MPAGPWNASPGRMVEMHRQQTGVVALIGGMTLAFFVLSPRVGKLGACPTGEPASWLQEAEPKAVEIVTARLPDGVLHKPYRVRLEARGGQAPYRWTLSGHALPEGVRLHARGAIAGTPVALGRHSFIVQVTDSSTPRQVAESSFTLRVAELLVLEDLSLPRAIVRQPYRAVLRASGGTLPLTWELIEGQLPAGLDLEAASGRLAGTPTEAGEFRFRVRATDSTDPPQITAREFRLNAVAALAVKWKRPPRIEAGGIFGSVQVANGTEDDFDLTLIVVAVNEYGKAFALGYQHFTLAKETEAAEIPFGFSLPRGDYVVHVDAVAEIPSKYSIHRARRQDGPLRVE